MALEKDSANVVTSNFSEDESEEEPLMIRILRTSAYKAPFPPAEVPLSTEPPDAKLPIEILFQTSLGTMGSSERIHEVFAFDIPSTSTSTARIPNRE